MKEIATLIMVGVSCIISLFDEPSSGIDDVNDISHIVDNAQFYPKGYVDTFKLHPMHFEKYKEEFEDDNIEFYMVGAGDVYCYVNNEEYDGKFPLAEIHAIQMDDEEEEYKIVGSLEANPFENRISNESPIGKSVLNKKVGDVVSVESPNGSYDIKIVAVS